MMMSKIFKIGIVFNLDKHNQDIPTGKYVY